jgi:outer membrane protein OmpA-like peptidoglycan-associated protein
MLRHRRHLILLCPLLLLTLLSRSQQKRRDTLVLHFAFDSHHIQPEDEAAIAASFRERTIDSLSITGYTDKTGATSYNQRLSERRANAAAAFLRTTRPGIPIPMAKITGGGVAPTPERSDSDNRRVEIVCYTTGSSATRHYDTITRHTAAQNPTPHQPPNDSIVVVKTTGKETREAINDSATADSAAPSTVLALRRINFIVDTPIPTDSTRRILPEFVTELRQFKDHKLEIDGYVNSIVPLRGKTDPLFILSVRRAKFIYDYLVDAGFDPGKLTYKGMGNASPINPHPTTKQEMNANMRVEIKVY